MDYSKTLHLPETEFPMRGNLPKKEPGFVEFWQQNHLYEKRIEKRKKEGAPTFVLHDGPPYANGKIHIGHALNKTLKDIIVRYHHMAGNEAIYVPGWDTHGLPIEYAVLKDSGEDRANMTPLELRRKCLAYAKKWIEIQKEDFIRMGVVGDFAHRYVTFDPHLEAKELEVFGEMANKGYIYKGKKAVYWCTHCETALAEAEIEYKDRKSPSIYVKYPMIDVHGLQPEGVDPSKVFAVIWTTTPWTIPASCYISVNPKFTYVWVHNKAADEYYLMNKELAPASLSDCKVEDYEFVGREMLGSELDLAKFEHPLAHFAPETYGDRTIYVLEGNHVTLDAGTGCVHTAPGHGVDDFEVYKTYENAGKLHQPIVCPVDEKGHMTVEAGEFLVGKTIWEAEGPVISTLAHEGRLLGKKSLHHQYAHCWRCKHPIIFRATPQWFCSVDSFKDEACAACDDVRWVPGWGIDRMKSMIRERADWCISRQRRWGLPIPVFYCKDCGKPICTDETIKAVSDLFAEKGSNAWFDMDAADILPKGFTCPHCGKNAGFTKEEDTLDGWFDSGSTHFASMKKDQGFWPATMYLEGLDQYRGWFQSSLLTAVGAFGDGAPFKECVTHGWTVDGEGKAMHKSLGNGVDPADVFNENGADILRLWAASADYHADVRCSKEIFKQLSQNYLKFRNTCKFMLDNLVDFDPEKLTKPEDMPVLDRWLLTKLNELIEKAEQSYCDYEFHIITHAVNDFCVNTLSSFYLDIVKDRLYCEGAESATRRSAQTALYLTLHTLSKLFAPILAFTCDEIWLAMPHTGDDDARNVVLNEMNKPFTAYALDSETMARWEHIIAVRTVVNGALEEARAAKVIGKSLEADVHLTVPESDRFFADESPEALADIFIVSKVELAIGDALAVKVDNAAGTKCPRCWKHSLEANAEGLCPRCAEVVKHLHLTELL